jgi:ribosome-associated toxin RatA of RatAB toxin-antitoxin module
MARASAAAVVPLAPQAAFDLWTDVSRWPTFVDGFGHAERLDRGWPEAGAKVVWRSVPGGRGTVTERVATSEPAQRFATTVFEEKLDGTQTATFEPAEDGEGTKVVLELDYSVSVGGPLRPVVDVLFIRRAQNDALVRTLRRFRTEAAEEAAL